jgi:molybdate transport system regulatory protein
VKVWLITGAYSGVGKTTLVRNLERILPDPVCVKIGDGRPKRGVPGHFFTSVENGLQFIHGQEGLKQHCLIESNRLVRCLEADIVIFLNGLDGERRADVDRLRKSADVVLGRGGNPERWRDRLAQLELPVRVRKKALEVLNEQHEYLCGSRLILRTKIWFTREGKYAFGEGPARLLEAIDARGSLAAAARAEGISYRHAWGDIRRAEERLGFALIERRAGGRSGGGSRLTEKGRRLLEGYLGLKRKSIKALEKWFRELADE